MHQLAPPRRLSRAVTLTAALLLGVAAPAFAGQVRSPMTGMMNGQAGGMMNGQIGGMMTTAPAATVSEPPSATEPATGSHAIRVVVLPDIKPGPDGHRHDAFMPSDFVVHAGQQATLVLRNYDDMPHTITAGELGINIILPPAKNATTPSVTTYRFTATRKGLFQWHCVLPCDGGDAHGWAMTAGFDGPGRHGYMAGFFVVL